MAETAELDTTQEVPSANGHDASFLTFDDDQALLTHILGKKPAEKLVDVPEWEVQVLCRALPTEPRIAVQIAASDDETKRYDYRKVFYLVALYGCYNPKTGNRIFKDSHINALKREQDGGAIERLAITILQLSHMVGGEQEQIKKN